MAYSNVRIEVINGEEVLKATREIITTNEVSTTKAQVEAEIAVVNAELTRLQNLLVRFS